MNREINFRGKRVGEYDVSDPCTRVIQGDPKWVYGYYVLSGTKGQEKHYILDEKDGTPWVVDPETVGQFVGLKDKNGVEIYEGDVIQTECNSGIKLSKFIVFYSSEFACFKKLREDGEIFNIDFFSEKSKVVIGNIHDNPDLIK